MAMESIQEMLQPVLNVITSKEPPSPGDMVQFQRSMYQHWGIYVGDGRVIHFTLPDWSETIGHVLAGETLMATVQIDHLKDVAGISLYARYNQFDAEHPPLPPETIVKRAESLLGLQLPYNVARSNCEHFATMMRYGTPEEGQAGLLGFTVDPAFTEQISQKLRDRDLLKTSLPTQPGEV